jgi:hypothetical protein
MSLLPKSKSRLLIYEFLTLLAIGLTIGILFSTFGKPVTAETAVTFLTSIAEISATIFSLFFAAALLLVGRSESAILRVMSKKDFVAGSFLFTLAILHSLISILTIEAGAIIDLRTFDALVLVIFPLMWMIYSIVVVSFFLWKLALHENEQSSEE